MAKAEITRTDLPFDDIRARLSWERHCGFLNLSLDEFRAIQEALLHEQLLLLSSSPLWQRFNIEGEISSLAELRSRCPLTSYEDYESLLADEDDSLLPEKPSFWAYTTSRSGQSKWVPYTKRAYTALARNVLAALILACADAKGDVNVSTADRILYTIAPSPFLTGHIARGLEQLGFQGLPPELHDELGFHGAVAESVHRALREGCSIMISPATVAATVAQRISSMSSNNNGGSNWSKLTDLRTLCRVGKARLTSYLDGRPVMPKDLWNLKGLVGWGIDTSILRESIKRSWGVEPYEFMASTEGGILALQSWTKKAMTFVPTSAYFEFLPEREMRQTNHGDALQQGDTVLLDELQAGERYEVIITSFYGMPFLRYRTGLMVRVTALADGRERVFLPQVELVGRSDGLIDLAGFTRLDERTIWAALVEAGVENSDWMARRENRGEESILALYIEVSDDTNLQDMKNRIHTALKERDADYRDVEELLGISPLEIRPLMPGAFDAYRQAAKGTGIQRDVAGWIPKTNAPQMVADRLVELSRRPVRGRDDGHRFLR